MSIGNASNLLGDQLKGIIADQASLQPTSGIVAAIGVNTIDVSLSTAGTIIHKVSVVSGTNGVLVGDTVYLLWFGAFALALPTRSYKGGVSTPGASVHMHDDLYYEKYQVDGLLGTKAPLGHTHSPKEIRAETGYIGGWSIDSSGIYQSHSRLGGLGYASFGNTPATGWGYNPGWGANYGVWIGWDYGVTDLAHALTPVYANDPEGNATAAGPKMAFYQDTTGSGGEIDYLVWTGTKLLIKAKNFTLSGAGNITASNVTLTGTITATAGSIGHWNIVANKIQSASTSIVMDADAESITLGTGILLDGANQRILVGASSPRILIDGSAKTVGTDTFSAGTKGFQLKAESGTLPAVAEFENIVARGEFRASVVTIGEQHAIGGSFMVLSAAPLYTDITTA